MSEKSLSEIARQAWLECPLNEDHWEAAVQAVRDAVIENLAQFSEEKAKEYRSEGDEEPNGETAYHCGKQNGALLLASYFRSLKSKGGDGCQASPGIKGKTVSAAPHQADIIADAALMKALGSVAWLADQEYRQDHSDSSLIATGLLRGLLRELRDGYRRVAESRNKENGDG